MTRRLWLFAASLLLPLTSAAFAQDQADLAKAAQNPVAAMISLPFQNNALLGVGPDDDVANVLNIQPVIAFTVGDWNIINRTIAPLIYLPSGSGLPELPEGVNRGSTFGLGDINHSIYLWPADSGPIIWGIGPSITFPTATDENIVSEKWSAGQGRPRWSPRSADRVGQTGRLCRRRPPASSPPTYHSPHGPRWPHPAGGRTNPSNDDGSTSWLFAVAPKTRRRELDLLRRVRTPGPRRGFAPPLCEPAHTQPRRVILALSARPARQASAPPFFGPRRPPHAR